MKTSIHLFIKFIIYKKNDNASTIKVLINARAFISRGFIRIITFHGEGDGLLLQAYK